MKKHCLKIIGIFFLIVTCIVGFRWLYLYELENLPSAQFSRLSREEQIKAEQFEKAFNAGEIVRGTILVFKDGDIGIFIGKRENIYGIESATYGVLLADGEKYYDYQHYFMLNVEEYYPLDNSSIDWTRKELLDKFSQGEKVEMSKK